ALTSRTHHSFPTRRSSDLLISTGTELICLTHNFAPGTHWDAWVKYPFGTGYLNAGRVIAVGPEVTGWHVGDRVASRGQHSSHVRSEERRVGKGVRLRVGPV